MNRLYTYYQNEVAPKLKQELKVESPMAVPRLRKVVLNIGVTDPQDPRARREVIANLVEQFRVITGQQPMVTRAKKSIAGFKLRQGDPLGVTVTLRGERMWQFVDKLISISLPRVKDFQGVSRTAFDGQGNYNLGIEEQIIFPEIVYDQINGVRSLQATFVTTAKNNDEGFKLLELLGMPFAKN
jgi:large subunit ribosomal protein L5